MVVFTCNNCGDSVKKPKTEKHITLECKRKNCGNVSLCCIDCLKDFNAQTYVAHTKCITEEERYSAPGFVPKPSSNKGVRKQDSWLEVVQSALNKPNLSEQQKYLLSIISNYENVPRKKLKFQNFIRNSANYRGSPKIIDEVYELLETEFKAMSAQQVKKIENASNDITSTKKDSTHSGESFPTKLDSVVNGNTQKETDETTPKLKSKKSEKKNGRIGNHTNGNVLDVDTTENTLSPEAGKQSKISSESGQKNQNNVSGIFQNEEDAFSTIKRKKKKKDKMKQSENSVKDDKSAANPNENSQPPTRVVDQNSDVSCAIKYNNNEIEDDNEMCNTIKKKKKSKKDKNKQHTEDNLIYDMIEADENQISESMNCEENNIPVNAENLPAISRKKEKKKRKFEQIETDDAVNSKRSRIENNENELLPNKFSWHDVVKTLLEKSKDGEMSMKKMTKKVVAEYQSSCSSTKSFEDIAKKFHKKIKKLPFVVVSKDRVQLYVQ